MLRLISILIVIQLPLNFIGRLLSESDFTEAQNFCNEIIRLVEKEKSSTGSYPKSLPEHIINKQKPRLLRDNRFYESDGKEFRLHFGFSIGMIGTSYIYESETGKWIVYE